MVGDTSPAPTAALGSCGIAGIDRWDAAFVAASNAVEAERGVRVDPRILKAMMVVESGGDGDYPPDRCRPHDAYDDVPACGPMQIKFPYHRQKCPSCDLKTVPGQVELAAHILGEAMARRGSHEYDAIAAVYFPGSDGPTTQKAYLDRVRSLVARMEADAEGTTPAPEPPKPADPLSAILGGKPVPAVTYGWLDDAGLNYYAYGAGHGTTRSTQHPGIDVPLPCGTPLYAPAAGVVDCVGNAGTPRWGQACGAYADVDGGGVGNVTILLDGGVKLTLGHCRTALVEPGQRVAAGQQVATVGSMNGCHVHVETSKRRADGSYQLVEPVAALRGVMGGNAAPAGPTLDVEVRIADGAGSNRPRQKLLAGDLWITVHETANPAPTADARMHRDFVNSGGGADRVSFHFAVDRARAVQILPLDERGFHAGDGCDNRATDHGCFRSVAIETCVNDPVGSAGWAQTKKNLAALVAGIVTTPERFVGGAVLKGRFSFDRVAPHQQWSGKNCPARMLAEGSLPAVVAEARSLAAGGGTTPAPLPDPQPDDVMLALFPQADVSRTGVVTAAWLACMERDRRAYPFVRRHDAADGSVLWVFTDLVLRSKDGKVEEVRAA